MNLSSLLARLGHKEDRRSCCPMPDEERDYIIQNHDDEAEPVRHRVPRYADSTWERFAEDEPLEARRLAGDR